MEPCHRAWLHFNVFVGRTSNLKSIYTLAQSGRNPGTVKPDTNYEMLPVCAVEPKQFTVNKKLS